MCAGTRLAGGIRHRGGATSWICITGCFPKFVASEGRSSAGVALNGCAGAARSTPCKVGHPTMSVPVPLFWSAVENLGGIQIKCQNIVEPDNLRRVCWHRNEGERRPGRAGSPRPGSTGANEWSNGRDSSERSRRVGASRQADRREPSAGSPINNNLNIRGLDS